jgi:hypothetical protein
MTATNLSLIIGTSTNTQYLTPNTINLYDNLDARTTLTFQMRVPTTASKPIVGQPVYLLSGTSYVFGGSLDSYSETTFPFTSYLQLNCNCVDFTQMLGKRLVYKSYTSSGLGEFILVATTDTRAGDGASKVWNLTYPVSTTPTVLVNGFTASVGTYGISSSTYGYYYTPSSNHLIGNSSNTAPASSDTLTITYSGINGLSAYDSDIIADINTNFFNGEGIDCATYVSTGIRIPEVNFNYLPGNEAINLICKLTGRSWYIDPMKQLHYFSRTGNPAPFSITSTSNNWRSLSIKHSRDKYRNKEFVLGSYGIIPTTEQFKGDGYTKTWTVTYPLYDTPTISVDGFPATVGILGVSASSFGYYWSKESNQITGNSTNAALASTDYIRISYNGLYPVVAVAIDGDEVATRAAIESNSGIYEDMDTDNKTYNALSAISYGNSLISKYGEQLNTISFETDIDGLASGQLIQVNVTANGINDYYYITSVTANDVQKTVMRYNVTAVSGQDRGGWVSFFRDLVTNLNAVSTDPYSNLIQTTAQTYYGNIRFADGVTVAATVLVLAYVDTAQVDSGVLT